MEHWATTNECENISNTIKVSAASRNLFFQIIFHLLIAQIENTHSIRGNQDKQEQPRDQ